LECQCRFVADGIDPGGIHWRHLRDSDGLRRIQLYGAAQGLDHAHGTNGEQSAEHHGSVQCYTRECHDEFADERNARNRVQRHFSSFWWNDAL